MIKGNNKNKKEKRMNEKEIVITPRDRLLMAWESSMEMVRDFETYSKELENESPRLSSVFSEYAEEEGYHAARFRKLLEEL